MGTMKKATRDAHDSDFDPNAPEECGDEYRLYADLRERCSMAWRGDLDGFWLPTRYENVVRAANDPAVFIVSVYNVIPDMAVGGRRWARIRPNIHSSAGRLIARCAKGGWNGWPSGLQPMLAANSVS